jgi:nitrite reductase/ring-hydroxylating ferredoxin subunit
LAVVEIPEPDLWKKRPFAPASGAVLGPFDEIVDGKAKEYTFGVGIAAFRMFVVRQGEAAFGYVNQCPHYSLPLNHRPDQFLTRSGDKIMCTQHLALFRIEDGACLDGACEGRSLDPVPVEVRDGQIRIG